MQGNLEQAIEIIRTLPFDERETLRRWIEKEDKFEKETRLKRDIERYKKAEKWLAENRDEYIGQWVCLYGDKLISHGTDALKVHRNAKEAGIEAPFLEYIIEEKYPFGGW